MPSRQQLETALINADKAGDVQAATTLANAIKNGQFDDAPQQLGPEVSAGPDIPPVPGGRFMTEQEAQQQGVDIQFPDVQGQPLQRPEFVGSGIIEPALTVASGIVAEPIAGVAGIAQSLNPFAEPGAGERAVERTREALTFVPKTDAGQEGLQTVSNVIEPVAQALQSIEQQAGDVGFNQGGAVGGAIGETVPTAALTALGLGSVRRALGISKGAALTKGIVTKGAKKLLKEAAPTIDGLKTAARGVYKEIDDLGAVVNSNRIDKLSNTLNATARKEGFNRRIHPKVAAALDEFNKIKGTDQKVTDIDVLRKVAKGAADSIEPSEARLGSLLVDKIDDTLDTLGTKDFKRGSGEVGAKYRDARQLWSRAKKSELLEDAFSKASLQATGFENGIRVQFRQILNNKKKLRGFNSEEIAAMRQVVKGGKAENLAKMIGRFGFSEGQASNMLMGSLGVAGGAAVGGAPGAVAVPLIGQLSRNLASKLTRNSAKGADAIVRAGKDGQEVVKAYLKVVPRKERSAQELTELLLRPGISLNDLKSTIKMMPVERQKLVADAVFFADTIQSQKNQSQ